MCGFVGWINDNKQEETPQTIQTLKYMNSLIEHRGPDAEGYYTDEHVHLAFARLSIIDIEHGHQPLTYRENRYVIIFNGEIYNYIELRQELIAKGHVFQTDSDTEVIVALYDQYQEAAVKKLRGMFAFVIWDKEEEVLFGARDQFGIKPFFIAEEKNHLYFASEKKSLLPEMTTTLDSTSLQHYLSFQYVPEPATMSKGIQKLESGHYFIKRPNHHVVVKPYWQTEFRTNYLPDAKAKQAIHDALTESVAIHMRSDVPVGSFLSGGIDSSLIVSLAKEINPNIKTFSVGFEREGFSEVDVARETADALGVENHSYLITPEEFMQALPDIMWHVDDPLADPAAVPLYFVAREASKQVKVALSGEGADELFGGYNIYREPDSLRLFNHMPTSLKRTLKNVSSLLPDGVKGKDFLLRGSVPLEERYIGNAKIFEEAEKKGILNHTFFDTSYQSVTKKYYNEATFYQDQVARMQYVDINTWLKGDILLKADKMSMAHSLELRVPFLDNQVFDIASRLSKEQKVSKGTTKLLLRQAAKGIVPNHVVNRKKLGFPVPIRHWLKDEMYSWAKNIIIESETEDLLNKKEVLALLEQHASGRKDNSRKLWTILMFMLWYSINIEGNQELIKMKAI